LSTSPGLAWDQSQASAVERAGRVIFNVLWIRSLCICSLVWSSAAGSSCAAGVRCAHAEAHSRPSRDVAPLSSATANTHSCMSFVVTDLPQVLKCSCCSRVCLLSCLIAGLEIEQFLCQCPAVLSALSLECFSSQRWLGRFHECQVVCVCVCVCVCVMNFLKL
jgi:hypothetical protein